MKEKFMLKPVDPKVNFPESEEEVLKFWDANRIFERTLEKTRDGKPFVFFEGPPTANGRPGIHHVEARAFKDLIPRYQTMRGRFVERKGGWDTHGLPVELQVEKQLGISGKKQIETIKPTVRESIEEFNRLCKESVWQYKEEWEKLTRRMGFWVDLMSPYITYHNTYIESLWWILKQAWEKDLVYLGHKVVPYCPRCGTALASHEVAQGYKNVTDTSVYVKFKVRGKGEGGRETNTYILSWTTTPWTLPGNVALAVGENIEYVKLEVMENHYPDGRVALANLSYDGKTGGPEEGVTQKPAYYILAKDRVRDVLNLPADSDFQMLAQTIRGSDMVGWEYEPLFEIPKLKSDKSYRVYGADFVTTTDGTGVVHTAVMYGEEDYQLGEQIGLPKFHTVDDAGHFIPSVPEVGGMYAKKKGTEEKIFEYLKSKGYLLRTQDYAHEYPHCWRCGTPLLYYARDSWFIRMSKYRDQLLANNEQITWVPEYIKHGRFGEWLREVKDWAISRERYWGTPLPIWKCADCHHHQIVGSIKELGLSKNTFYFTRHGQAENNVLGISDCWPEIKPYHLTDLGQSQAKMGGERLRELGGVDLIFASDLQRDRETAEIMGKILGVEVQYDERIREINVGKFNGRPYEDYWNALSFDERWNQAPEGGETNTQVQERMLSFVNEINQKYDGKKILVVSHGDPLWILMKYFGADHGYPKYGTPFELNVDVRDLHRPFIDDVVLKCEKCGKDAHRVPAVMDVWFDSGAMPYAQWHYPFENQEKIDQGESFPADYISEAIDQTRGWFYTLLAVSTVLEKGPAYKNVINLGHLLDDKGQKMSKSKGNVVDPWEVINTHGVDGVRWYMYSVNQPGDTKLFGVRDVEITVRKNFLTLWNVLSFLTTYAAHDNWEPEQGEVGRGKRNQNDVLDQWIMIKTQELVNTVTKNLDEYDVFRSARAIEEFISELSTWYVRRSRTRRGSELYQTLYDVLKTLAKLMAPFTPFLAEKIWQTLKLEKDPVSVHLADWPEVSELSAGESELLAQMESVRKIVEIGHSVRKASKIKVRQPLAAASYSGKANLPEPLEAIIADELNAQSVNFVGDGEVSVVFDTNITPELKQMGLARELERLVQDIRKKSGLQVGETVNLTYHTNDGELIAAFSLFDTKKTYVNQISEGAGGEEYEIEGKKIAIRLE